MLRKTIVTLAEREPSVAETVSSERNGNAAASPWRAFEMQSHGRFQQRINEVTLVPFTRLEVRQLLTSIERIDEKDFGPELTLDSLREKLRSALQRMTN
jgi:hypothetical protein